MEDKLPKRKNPRLSGFDYSSNGAYFITICTKDRKNLFGPVGADSISARIIKQTFLEIIGKYDGVECPVFVVMPNHFHAIITISRANMEFAPTISRIVQEFKRYSTVEYAKEVKRGNLEMFEKQIWQRSFHDHIIRDRNDYEKIYKYICENPLSWEKDELFVE
ncbi:MAG: transposase [Clostridia bacterium]|nr:transposase [Clostridia bacterium]